MEDEADKNIDVVSAGAPHFRRRIPRCTVLYRLVPAWGAALGLHMLFWRGNRQAPVATSILDSLLLLGLSHYQTKPTT